MYQEHQPIQHKLSDSEFIARLPKAELHVHLEGSLPPATVLKLAENNGLRPPFETLEDSAAYFQYRDFPHFLDIFMEVCGYLRTPQDYYLLVKDFLADAKAQNIRYREAFFSPTMHLGKPGLSQDALLEALAAGVKDGYAEHGVELHFIADISRQFVPEADPVVDFAIAGRADDLFIGVGIGGAEAGFPPRLFESHMSRARAAGLHSVAHAGEAAGPESVWEALRVTKSERLGHGVRSIEDAALIEYLRETQTPLEVCPTSNLCTGVYESYAAHPLRQLCDAGLAVTIGSDDPPFFGSSLSDEYVHLLTDFGFSRQDVCRLSCNAIDYSFLPSDRKTAYGREFEREFRALGQ
ncbi:MAG: adenosine deaminase [Acidobacteria bacterium]|nr:adenosine deaminase [Acidobacteriota bacterium]